jgi:hypothetical protein
VTRRLLLTLAALSCLLAPPLVLTGTQSPVRVAAVLGVLALAPGLASLPWTARAAPDELALVVGTSLGLSALGAQVMLWLDAWSPATAMCVVSGVCLLVIAARLAWRRRVTA